MIPQAAQFRPVPVPDATMIITGVIAVGLLLAICIFLGLAGKKQWKTFDEYLVGKRDIGPVVTGAALSASYISGWAFCGSTGIVYTLGFSGMWFAGIFSLVGIVPCIWLAAAKTRDFAAKLGAATLPETIGRRFESKALQTVVAIAMLFFLFLYSVGQLKAGGTVWYAMTGLSPLWCLLLSVFVAWLYMVLGGYVGNQYAMAFQGLIFAIVGTILGLWAIIHIGGFWGVAQAIAAQNPKLMTLIRPELPKIGFTQLMSSWVGILACPVIFFTMAVGFPHNVSRFLGMKKVTKRDYWLLVLIVWLFTGIPIMLDCSSNGLVARVIYGPALLKIEPWKGDLAAPYLSYALGGPWLLAAYTAGLFSAALSTLAGMVFIMSANVTRDVIKSWWPDVSDKSMLYLGYFLIALFLFLPFYFTLVRPPELLSIFMGMAAMGLGAVFFFVTAISYYWKRATKWGAMACVVWGTVFTLYGSYAVLAKKPPLYGMGSYEWFLVISCGLIYFIVSAITKPPSKEHLDKLFGTPLAK
ncbi:MAG: Sodium/proline symporter [Syntrophorhabdus sp. PtaB.Bin006]|nr:MAG: Sodium/proline symporter [Syntrophorhabdus sp. PtaB.Bin006]